MNPMGLIFIAAGIFAVCGAGFDWEFFMNNHKARFMSSLLSRTGARIFYGLLGTGLIVLGVLVMLGYVQDRS